jgi:hypothetical protein
MGVGVVVAAFDMLVVFAADCTVLRATAVGSAARSCNVEPPTRSTAISSRASSFSRVNSVRAYP